MKMKFIMSICLLLLIAFQAIGCSDITRINTGKNLKIQSEVNMAENDIREIAYKSLDEKSKGAIIDWKKAKVEEYKSEKVHSVGNQKEIVNIKGKDTYKVNFRTNNEGLLGPLIIYIDKNSYNILGIDLRD